MLAEFVSTSTGCAVQCLALINWPNNKLLKCNGKIHNISFACTLQHVDDLFIFASKHYKLNEGRERISFWSWNQTPDLVNHLCSTLLSFIKYRPNIMLTRETGAHRINLVSEVAMAQHELPITRDVAIHFLPLPFAITDVSECGRMPVKISSPCQFRFSYHESWCCCCFFFVAHITLSFFAETFSFEASHATATNEGSKKYK